MESKGILFKDTQKEMMKWIYKRFDIEFIKEDKSKEESGTAAEEETGFEIGISIGII